VLHPDIVAVVLTAAGLFFVYEAYTQMPPALIPIVIVLVLGILVYFYYRKASVKKYDEMMAESNEETVSMDQAIALWMKLYYCGRDGLVFDPESNRHIPLDEMKKFLLRPNRKP
jgi:hypothetical protein